jgi:L-iditol 2-dehydrogenase
VQGLTKLAPGPGHVALAERPERDPGPGEVVLDVVAAGICGTDLHIEAGEYPSVPPVTMGHEVSGVVAALGDGVPTSWLGRPVATETYASTCGACRHCRDGRRNLCAARRSIGTHVDGGFAARLVVPASNLHPLPPDLDPEAASALEPLACVCNSLFERSVVTAGDEVLVVGPGAVGLLAAQAARAAGAHVHVRGTARDEARLELADRLGFATSAAGGARDDGYPGEAADVVVECSGSPAGIATGLTAARRGGRLVQMGLHGGPVELPYDLICFHELVVTAGFASTTASWRRALTLVEAGAVDLRPLLTAVLPLEEWERAFAASRQADGVKYALVPG